MQKVIPDSPLAGLLVTLGWIEPSRHRATVQALDARMVVEMVTVSSDARSAHTQYTLMLTDRGARVLRALRASLASVQIARLGVVEVHGRGLQS